MEPPEPPQPLPTEEPPVLVVVAPRHGGSELASVLADLQGQDHDRLIIRVAAPPSVDTDIEGLDPEHVLPVRRAGCYADAFDAVMAANTMAPSVVFCRDDVEPAPDAISAMIACAETHDAAIVGCKVVERTRPDRLVSVGLGIDKLGGTMHRVDIDELDQGQHDSVSDALAADFSFFLVDAELLASLDGFDRQIDAVGDDVDFCWRAHAVGAKIAVAADAAVLHDPPRLDSRRRMRHQLRSVFGTYGAANLLLAVPLLLILSIGEVAGSILTARPRRLRNIVGAWTWNLTRLPSLFERRTRIHRAREVADVRLRYRLLDRDPAWRLFDYTRHDADEERNRGQEFVDALRSASTRAGVAMWMILVVAFVFGSRLVLTGDLPAVGQFQPVPDQPGHLIAQWWTGYSKAGLGVESVGPTGALGAGLLFTILSPITEAARIALFLSMLPLAAVGAWKLSRPLGRTHARVALVIAYLAVPISYDAFARGDWAALAMFAGAPWMLWRMVRLLRAAPYGYLGGTKHPSVPNQPLLYQSLILGVVIGLVAMASPFVVFVVVALVVGLAIGSFFALQMRGIPRVLIGVAIAGGAAVLIHLPWVVALLERPLDWNAIGGSTPATDRGTSLLDLLQFDSGPAGLQYVSLGLFIAGVPGLLFGRGWRLAWASRGWFIALTGFALAWVAERGWLEVSMPSEELLLVPAALGLAVAAAASVAAYEIDVVDAHPRKVPARKVLVGAIGIIGLSVATLPAVVAAFDGRWNIPKNDLETAVGFVALDQSDGPFRILWIGDDSVMPVRGWPLGDESSLTFAATDGRAPTLADQWLVPENNAAGRLRDIVEVATSGQSARIGSDLADVGVKYIILVEANATFVSDRVDVPVSLVRALGRQLDLRVVDGTNSAITVFENQVWVPTRVLTPSVEGEDIDLTLGRTQLQPSGYVEFTGRLQGDSAFYLSAAADRWSLELDGERQERTSVDGVAGQWAVEQDSDALLRYETPGRYRSLTLIQLAGWVVIVISIAGWRSRMERGV